MSLQISHMSIDDLLFIYENNRISVSAHRKGKFSNGFKHFSVARDVREPNSFEVVLKRPTEENLRSYLDNHPRSRIWLDAPTTAIGLRQHLLELTTKLQLSKASVICGEPFFPIYDRDILEHGFIKPFITEAPLQIYDCLYLKDVVSRADINKIKLLLPDYKSNIYSVWTNPQSGGNQELINTMNVFKRWNLHV